MKKILITDADIVENPIFLQHNTSPVGPKIMQKAAPLLIGALFFVCFALVPTSVYAVTPTPSSGPTNVQVDTPANATGNVPDTKQMIIRQLPDQASGVSQSNLLEEYRVLQGIWRAEVVETNNAHESVIPGTKKEIMLQDVTVRLLNGQNKGKVVLVENDFRELKKGDKVLVNYFVNRSIELYSINERDRRGVLLFIGLLFLAGMIFIGRGQIIRSLAGLGGALVVIGLILIPALLYGFPALLTCIVAGIAILFSIVYFTYGLRTDSTLACIGGASAVIVAGIISWGVIVLTKVSGLGSDEVLFVNFNTPTNMDFMGLILGGIILGSLGALAQVAISQVGIAKKVNEDNPEMNSKEMFKAALSDGKGQIGAFFNTVTLAYIGATLPLLMLFSMSTFGLDIVINQEIFAIEIIRIVIAGVGLLCVVPITTLLSIYFFRQSNTALLRKKK